MGKIVLGIGTSHGPMLSTQPEQWDLRVPFDVANRHPFRDGVYSFDELVALRKDENLQREIGVDVWRTRHAQCRAAIERSAEIFAAARPVPKKKIRREDALEYHSRGRKGKIEVVPSKP